MPPPEKDFDVWNEQKKRIQVSDSRQDYSEGDIWWCVLGTNIGSEQDGTGSKYDRPVLILKEINKETCYVVPLTTAKKLSQYRIPIGKIGKRENVANISQIRVVDTKRLDLRIGSLDPCMFLYIREMARNLF
jgi:mRNA interferase MazF